MTSDNKDSRNGLRQALDARIVESLSELSELRGELRATLRAIDDKIDRLLDLHERVDRNTVAIARPKTIAALVAAGVATLVTWVKEWFFGGR